MVRPESVPTAPLLVARGLSFEPGGVPVLVGLDFEVGPGLTLVLGGDGRGKTTLLRLMAGATAPTSGVLRTPGGRPYAPDPSDPAADDVIALDWLGRERAGFTAWDDALATTLVEGFALREHLGKALFRLSTGTRRKLALVAAFAAGAPLALLDVPFAGLDGASRTLLSELLAEGAAHRSRGWVLADHALPPSLRGVPLAATIDLGD
jgi:ABC-type multidrug transport system ATPase subunit